MAKPPVGLLRPVALLLTGVLAAGCGGLSSTPAHPMNFGDVSRGLEAEVSGTTISGCIATPLDAQDLCRDRIVQSMMVLIDMNYTVFERELNDTNRYSGFATSVAVMGLAGAASISSVPVSTARILSALAAGLTGAREAFDRDVLAERTTTSLLVSMRANRNTIARRIRNGLKARARDYPVGTALQDLLAYFRAGTIQGAIVNVAEAVGLSAFEARLALDGRRLTEQPLPPDRPLSPQPQPPASQPARAPLTIPPPLPPEELRLQQCLLQMLRDPDPLRREQNEANMRRVVQELLPGQNVPPRRVIQSASLRPELLELGRRLCPPPPPAPGAAVSSPPVVITPAPAGPRPLNPPEGAAPGR
ncbi:hypothetical protein KPL78_04035 [Roseomonas sp. HJA6]|uniref:Uncharacterized protein n=1 Tax=Roseomonas alba TaxID=2846776 RepID=A0ABS7A3X7_9PROT|nr:hypothetical protein [Neoroseomonas alba]MBW6397002.1 hypothetical protein [Neoroseomonas alba]